MYYKGFGRRPGLAGVISRWWWLPLIVTAAGGFLGIPAGMILAHAAPKKFESKAILQVKPEAKAVLGSPYGIIRSSACLNRVADQLDLDSKWGQPRADIVKSLNDNVGVNNIRDTDIFEIKVRGATSADARSIADELAQTSAALLKEADRTEAQKDIQTLTQIVHDMADDVDQNLKVEIERAHEGVYGKTPEMLKAVENLKAKQAELDGKLKGVSNAGAGVSVVLGEQAGPVVTVDDDPAPFYRLAITRGLLIGLALALPMMFLCDRWFSPKEV